MAETKILEVNGKKFSIKDVTDEQTCSQDPKSASIDKTLQPTIDLLRKELAESKKESDENLGLYRQWEKYGEEQAKESAENLGLYKQWEKYGEEQAKEVEELKLKVENCKVKTGGNRKSKEYLKYKKEYIKLKNQL
jgi:hypothetical protein